ncbi:MAG: transposase [Bacilli bacterium]
MTINPIINTINNVLVSMEDTGSYWLSLYSALNDKDFNVSVYNPYQIKAYRGAYNNRKQKNDTIDFIIIADYLRVFGSQTTTLPKDDLLSLKTLTRFRSGFVDSIATSKTQVIGILDKAFPEYKKAFFETFGVTSKQVHLNYPTPDDILKINLTKLSNLLSKHSKGPLGKSSALNLKSLAKNSFGIKFTNEKTSKRGSPYPRHAIYVATLVAMSNDSTLRTYYGQKISEGKHHYVALAGISRKILTIIYYILKEDRDYIKYDDIH